MRAPFKESVSSHVKFLPYPSSDSCEETLSKARELLANRQFGAVIVEPIQGRGGGRIPHPDFLAGLRKACDETGTLLILDEILTGAGRTGRWTASAPGLADVLCLGKAIAGGIPASVCLGREEVMQAWGAHGGSAIHTATHFGNPLQARAIVTTMQRLAEPGVLERVRAAGLFVLKALRAAGFSCCGEGLMFGVTFRDSREALAISRKLLGRGIIALTGGLQGQYLLPSPAYTISDEQLQFFVNELVVVSQ